MKNKKFIKICAGVLAIATIITTSAFAVGAVTNSGTTKAATTISAAAASEKAKIKFKFFGRCFGQRKGPGKGIPAAELKAAVTANVITQAENDSITAYIKAQKVAPKTDLFSALVTKNILTQAKADALKAFFETQREQKEQAALKARLDKLVTKTTITQAQEDKIIAAVNAAQAARKAAFDKAATMSKADAKTYLDNFRKTQVNPLKALVTDGTLTQKQANKVAKVLHHGMGPEFGPGPGRFVGRGCPRGPKGK